MLQRSCDLAGNLKRWRAAPPHMQRAPSRVLLAPDSQKRPHLRALSKERRSHEAHLQITSVLS